MGVSYAPVLWNKQKKRYDLIMIGGIVVYLLVFIGLTLSINAEITQETLLIRATGSLAITMLHIILVIGPLCRLNPWFLPLLYNRRHLGVTMFLIGAIHGTFSILQFHALGNINPIVSLFVSNADYSSISQFPFQTLGFLALLVLFLMAATSHDFWLANLKPKVWKALHMMIYVAYGLLIGHVVLGVVQNDAPIVVIVLFGTGMATVVLLHLMAAMKETKADQKGYIQPNEAFVEVATLDEIPEGRAKIVNFGDDRVALFKYDGKLSAVSNVCCHQNGPLGEGKIIDGLITCPWHGYQYRPEDGCAPTPFTEKIATYHVRLVGNKILVDPNANPDGTPVEPARYV